MPDWEQIELDIKDTDNHWERFSFLTEQIAHAYVNLYVEKGRKYNIPKPLCKLIAYGSLASPIPFIVGAIALIKWTY